MAIGAEAMLLGGRDLAAALAEGPPCCVIDARPPTARALRPLPDAIAYREGLRIRPSAAVVVIGEGDDVALRIGNEVGRANNAPRVIAVKGGLAAWKAATSPAASGTGTPAFSFVIPKNTCEQGEPLQHFPAKPAR
jgi:hypothetical protein